MKIFRALAVPMLAAVSFMVAMTVTAMPASAQATRTWVSGVGDDVNPCSRTAPCKTFAGAISKTAAGGEINCLDPGGFGAVTITKSMTIDCTGTFGSTLNSGGINGINVNDSLSAAPNTSDVILRGLSINGSGTTLGLNGIRFTSGRSLVVQDVIIQDQSGAGVSFAPAAAAELYLHDVTITGVANGVAVQPTGAGGSARVTLDNVRVVNASANGYSGNTTGNTSAAGISAIVKEGNFDGGLFGVLVTTAVGTAPSSVMVTNSEVFNNGGVGIRADGASARARVSHTTITGNSTGVSAINGGAVSSFGNNVLEFNGTDGTFTAPTLLEE
jgi:hypothetical protein